MPSLTSFDDLGDNNQAENKPEGPIWKIDLDDPSQEEKIRKWLVGEITFLREEDQDRMRQIQRNMALYKGIQYNDQNTRNFRDDPREVNRLKRPRKIVVNHLYDLTEQRVSKLVKFRPAVAALPTHDDYPDRLASKTVEEWIKHIFYQENLDGEIAPEVARTGSVQGEGYLFIEWDPEKGEEHPDSIKEREENDGKVMIPLMGDDDKPQVDEQGKTIMIEKVIKVGDVCHEPEFAYNMFLEKTDDFKRCNYAFRRKIWDVDELKAKYPSKAGSIKATEDANTYDFESMEVRKLGNRVLTYYFYHKDHPQLPGGREIHFTPDVILINRKSRYSHGGFPFERWDDVPVPGERHAVSFYNNVRALTSQYNNLTNMIVRSQALMAHAKWVTPAGACKIEQLGNDHTIVQYKGQIPPQLVQANPTGAELFKFREQLKEEFQQLAGVFGVSRGEPPPGIKAGVALQFLSEQENERSNAAILSWNDFIRRVAIKTLSVAADFYDPSDERTIRVMGRDNEWMIKELDPEDLNRDYDLRIQNTSALPQSKAARIQTLLDLNEQFPNQLTPERVLDMLDFAQEQKFVDAASAAVKASEAENYKILEEGDGPGTVEDYEDHIIHWQTHITKLQEHQFKAQIPKKHQEDFKKHVKAHEMLMAEKAKVDPGFAEKLATLELYPLFFKEVKPTDGETEIIPPGPAGGPLQPVPELPQGAFETPPAEAPPISDQGGLEAVQPVAPNINPGAQ